MNKAFPLNLESWKTTTTESALHPRFRDDQLCGENDDVPFDFRRPRAFSSFRPFEIV